MTFQKSIVIIVNKVLEKLNYYKISTLTIDIPDDIPEELLSKVDEYRAIHQKSSREQAIKELLNNVLSLPPYFDNMEDFQLLFAPERLKKLSPCELETLEILSNVEQAKIILASIKEADRGEAIAIEFVLEY